MSVIPLPALPEPTAVPEPVEADAAPLLRLLPTHEHAWRLRTVEYDDGLEVRRYECTDCDDVLFR